MIKIMIKKYVLSTQRHKPQTAQKMPGRNKKSDISEDTAYLVYADTLLQSLNQERHAGLNTRHRFHLLHGRIDTEIFFSHN